MSTKMSPAIPQELLVYSKDYIDKMYDRVVKQRKVSFNQYAQKAFGDAWKKIWEFIFLLNTLAENTIIICGRDIKDIMIPKEFSDFILPNSVRYDTADRRSDDLLIRFTSDSDISAFDYNKYIDAVSEYRALFKMGPSDNMISLADIRKNVSFEDVRPRMVIGYQNPDNEYLDYYMHYDGTPFIPIALNYGFGMFKETYFNADESEVSSHWLENFKVCD